MEINNYRKPHFQTAAPFHWK